MLPVATVALHPNACCPFLPNEFHIPIESCDLPTPLRTLLGPGAVEFCTSSSPRRSRNLGTSRDGETVAAPITPRYSSRPQLCLICHQSAQTRLLTTMVRSCGNTLDPPSECAVLWCPVLACSVGTLGSRTRLGNCYRTS